MRALEAAGDEHTDSEEDGRGRSGHAVLLPRLGPRLWRGRGPPSVPPIATEVVVGASRSDLNVVLITIDTLRSDRLSCYGSQRVETPVMDAFAREGVLFANAASTVPFTLPAHTSILTGLYPPGHGVRENVGYTVGEELTALAEVLSDNGWSTVAFVSAFVLDSRWGIAQGFDHYHDEFDLSTFDEAPNLSAVQRPGEETIAEAVEWLDERPPDEPFFLWLHLYDPHDPYTQPEPWASQYPNRPYDGEVAYTDSLVGTFRSALEERGLMKSSLVVLTADHGEGLGDHGESSHGFFVYDTTIHVPLIIREPDTASGGRFVSAGGDQLREVDRTCTELLSCPVQPRSAHGSSR